MLPFKNRLVKRKDFEDVFRIGSAYSQGNVLIKISKNGLNETRIGFVVGAKFSKKAVERNEMKRRLREIFRKKLAEIEAGWDVVVLGRKREGEKIRFQRLAEDVDAALEKAGLKKQIKN